MIKIELTKREEILLEIGYLGNLSKRSLKKNKFTLEQLVNDVTTSEANLLSWRNQFGLERVKRKHDTLYAQYAEKCNYIASKKFPMKHKYFFRESLLINPIYIVHTPYNMINKRDWKKIKSIVNLIELYNLDISSDTELLNWLKVEDHYDSIKVMLGTLDVDMAKSYEDCERVIIKKSVTLIDELKSNLKSIRDFVDRVYDYKNLVGTKMHYEISCLAKISVCPYCNRQYITVLNTTEKGTATFDHYYREETYPIFKLSLYNLVPSCYACNSILKGKSDEEHLNPWFMEREEIQFDVKLNKDEEHFLKNYYTGYGNREYVDAEIQVKNAGIGDVKTDNSLDVFKLPDVYKAHTQYAAKFAAKAKKYEQGKYKKMLVDKLKATGFAVDEEMVDQMVYGFPSKVIGTKEESKYAMNMPLYKLKRDLVKKSKGAV